MTVRRLTTWISVAVVLVCADIGSPANALPANRYTNILFVCRSIDPSDSRLNLRGLPGGIVKDTISRKEFFYVWGGDLIAPQKGYVPVHFLRPLSRPAGQRPKELPAGWVWKDYITCEISN